MQPDPRELEETEDDPRELGDECEAPDEIEPELCVIVPSRGRPTNISRLIDAWVTTGAQAALHVALDRDDPRLDTYQEMVTEDEEDPFDPNPEPTIISHPGYRDIKIPDEHIGNIWMSENKRTRLGPTLNREATRAAKKYPYVGFMGDDHLPQTREWDAAIVHELKRLGTGIVYGNDLMQGANLPTAVFMSSDIINALGYMVPIGLVHLFLDNAWKRWGEEINRLSYLEAVIIEHIHPQAGKAPWDEGYTTVNGGAMWEHDEAVYNEYVEQRLPADVEKLKALL